MKFLLSRLLIIGCAMSMIFAPNAVAQTSEQLTLESAVSAVKAASDTEGDELSFQGHEIESASTEDGHQTTLTKNPSKELQIETVDNPGDAIEVTLPQNLGLQEGEIVEGNTLAFESQKENVVITSESVEGALRIHSVIGDTTAPSSFSYGLDLPDGASWTMHEEGILEVKDREGNTTLIVAPPWAKDSTGAELPTSFDFDGKTLTQHIDTVGVPVENYPIVADPYMGRALFHGFNADKQFEGDVVYSAYKTRWGQFVHNGFCIPAGIRTCVATKTATILRGQSIMRTEGWVEWFNQWPEITNKQTLYQQYSCHVLGGFYNLADDWNLERARPDKSNWLTDNLHKHRCNW